VRPLDAGNHHAGINYFGNTSTMEYQWERFGETVGLGAYDFYAMGVLYGRVVETMESDEARGGMPAEEQRRFSPRLRSQLGERDSPNWNDPAFGPRRRATPRFGSPRHYTELARQLRVFDPSAAATRPRRAERYRWRLVDGKICRFAPRDHAALPTWRPRRCTTPRGARAGERPRGRGPRGACAPASPDGGRRVRSAGATACRGTAAWATPTSSSSTRARTSTRSRAPSSSGSTTSRTPRCTSAAATASGRAGASPGVASRMFRLVRGYHWNVARDIALYRGALNDATFQALRALRGLPRPDGGDPARHVQLLRRRADAPRRGQLLARGQPRVLLRQRPHAGDGRGQPAHLQHRRAPRHAGVRHRPRQRPLHRRRLRQLPGRLARLQLVPAPRGRQHGEDLRVHHADGHGPPSPA
jgi:hypothetical protein